MLKLERTARDQLNVLLNDKERFFNPPLLIAFALATFIHLLLFLIFQITPLTLRLNERIYPPMVVQVGPLINPAAAVMAATSPATQTKDHLPNLPPLRPVVPEVPTFTTIRYMDEIKQNLQEINPFSPIEKDIYAPPILAVKPPSTKPNLAVIISGPLSSIPLVKAPLLTSPLVFIRGQAPLRVVYTVVADKTSGKIVWYTLKEPASNSQVNALAEKIMLDMQFAKNITGFTIDGEVELHFHNNGANES
jgi:hypothetical protein